MLHETYERFTNYAINNVNQTPRLHEYTILMKFFDCVILVIYQLIYFILFILYLRDKQNVIFNLFSFLLI